MLSNEQAKQEAIKKAYDLMYDKCRPNNEGWTFYKSYRVIHNGRHFENFGLNREDVIVEYDYSNPPNLKWMPKRLFGLKDNNGWIRIEPDGSNLPIIDYSKDIVFYKYMVGDKISVGEADANDLKSLRELYPNQITHYKPIKEELKPVY